MSPIERSAGGGGGGGTGVELDYVQITANVAITGATDATATTILTGNAVTFSGSQRVQVEFYTAGYQLASLNEIVIVVYDGATVLGRALVGVNGAGITTDIAGGKLGRFLTPSAGSHTFSIRGWRVNAATCNVYAGDGTSGNPMPAWYRITTA